MSTYRRGMRTALIVLLAMCLVFGFTATAYAANTGSTPTVDTNAALGSVTKTVMTFYGDTKTTRGFTWYTSAASVGSTLQVLKKTSDTADFTSADVKTFTGVCQTPTNLPANTILKAQEYLHKAEATGLEAGTTYFFRVGDSATSPALWSDTGTFTTASASGGFTFLDLADPQAKEEDEAKLAASSFKKAVSTVPGAEFIAVNGDIVDSGNLEYQWDWLFENMKSVMLNYTFAPIAGNHESNAYSFIDHFDLNPASGSATTSGAYYSFDYQNAHFVMLNTNESSATYSDFSTDQVAWLQADIAAAKTNGARWIIAVLHKGPYTTSNHATDTDIEGATGVRNMVAPIFENLGVDLVLQGHDHIYARSKPIKQDGTTAVKSVISETVNGRRIQYQVNNDGTVYLIPATSGPKVYYKNAKEPSDYYDHFDVADESHAAIYGPDPADATRPERSQIQNFESITINGDKLTVISYEIDQNFNDANPYVIDTFGLEKGTGLTDATNPVVKLDAYVTAATNKDVVVTARTNEGTFANSKDIESHTFTANGKYSFVATDAAGNKTTKIVTIGNIDKTAPVITINPYTTDPTNKDITVTAKTNEGTLNAASHTFTANGSFDFVATDAAGNVTTKTVTITNIVKDGPVITVAPYMTDPTNKDITVNASADKGTLNAASHTFTENGSFDFVATDSLGNTTTKTVTITNIDKTAPVITIEPYTKTPTNKDITVTAKTNEGTLNAASHTFTANGSFDFVATDAAGNKTTKTVTITNIVKNGPIITIAPYTTTPTNKNITVTAKTSEGTLNAASHTFTANGSFDFVATDAAGNKTVKTVTITNIDKTAPVITVKTASGTVVKNGASIKSTRLVVSYKEANYASKTALRNNKSVSWPSNGVFTAKGSYVFTVKDKAGNTATFKVTLK